jgi:hypothetical protein
LYNIDKRSLKKSFGFGGLELAGFLQYFLPRRHVMQSYKEVIHAAFPYLVLAPFLFYVPFFLMSFFS